MRHCCSYPVTSHHKNTLFCFYKAGISKPVDFLVSFYLLLYSSIALQGLMSVIHGNDLLVFNFLLHEMSVWENLSFAGAVVQFIRGP